MTDNIATDILKGASEIAEFLGFDRRSVYHAAANDNLPHFKMGSTVCARKSTLLAWIEEQEAKAKAG